MMAAYTIPAEKQFALMQMTEKDLVEVVRSFVCGYSVTAERWDHTRLLDGKKGTLSCSSVYHALLSRLSFGRIPALWGNLNSYKDGGLNGYVWVRDAYLMRLKAIEI